MRVRHRGELATPVGRRARLRTCALRPNAQRAANVDPALASSVFITTLTDVFGFFAFLGLATLFIEYLDQVP